MKIKFLLESMGYDVLYKVGDIADLGDKRNESAVERGRAEWIVEDVKQVKILKKVKKVK
jgi:hypothetical protein